MKQFNNKAILTTKNPEVFLNFTFDSGNPSYYIIPEASIASKILYVNGLDINQYSASIGYSLKLTSVNNIASFHVYSDVNYKFDTNLTFKFYDVEDISSGTTDVSTHDVSILNRPFILETGIVNNYNNEDLLIDDEASYLILRTNPKFTGNIKLRVDENHKMYLDTFPMSDALSNTKYRRKQISANSVLSSDIRNAFSSLSSGDMYYMNKDDVLSIAIPKTEYKDQYNTTYNYGARLLKDELYSEDNGLLAPLWINSKLPDYFAVFRLNGVFNQETYDGSALTDLAFKYLKESDIVKSWSLQPAAPLGKYLTTHLNDIIKYRSPVFLSLANSTAVDADPNTWYGISFEKGIVTGKSETTYQFNQNSNNFTKLNKFISQGFERQKLLSNNLLNIEYVFSDEDVSLYTMNRYFGLYLTENVLYNIAYYSDISNGTISILSLDGKDSSIFFNSSIFDTSTGDIMDAYKNRLFVLNDGEHIYRITNVNEVNDTIFNSYVSKPYENIFSTTVEKTNINPFITLTLNNRLEQGEHLRIRNITTDKIWEIYAVDFSSYDCNKYCSISENTGFSTVYRTHFNVSGSLYDQILEIENAFDRFADYDGTYFRSGIHGDNWMSIILNDDANLTDEWVFERITASTRANFNDSSTSFNNAALPNDITFFGRFTPSASDFEIVAYDNALHGPIDFELYGDRQSITLSFIDRGTNNLYSIDNTQNITNKFENPTLYQDVSLWYRKFLEFDVSNNSYLYVKDPLNEDRVLIMTDIEVKSINDRINAYSIHPLNISLMGINPVKDIDYTVYDSSLGFESEYWYKREDDASTYNFSIDASSNYTFTVPGSYVIKSGIGTMTQNAITQSYDTSTIFNTFDSSIYFETNTATLISYAVLNGTHTYTSYDSSFNEENLYDYYDSSTLLKYPLTVPYVSKWTSLGDDCRNNPLLLTSSNFINSFIPTSTQFTQEISYPSFKYLSSGEKAWENYIYYDINDVILDGSTYRTFKEMMWTYPYVDYFSKLVYSNYDVEAKKTRSSIAYYNGYKNSVNTIHSGLNISIKVEDIAKSLFDIKQYDKYRFSLISTSSKNKDNKYPIEVIINENTKTILMVWYQGNDELNYNARYSTFLPGKSLLDASNRGFVSGIDQSTYSFVKTPFIVNNEILTKLMINQYDNKSSYDSSIARPYSQYNKNLNNFNSTWNSFGNNSITNLFFTSPKSYNTFSQYVDYSYKIDDNAYGDYVINYGYNYNSNTNHFINSTTNLNTLTYLLSPSRKNVMYYILRENLIYTSYDFGSRNPFIISVITPSSYDGINVYNGWFKPKFNNILEFKCNEEKDLVNIVDRDFIFSNTNLRTYNPIYQLWYNKVTDNISQIDVSVGNAISYITNFNAFKALWDADYFIKNSNLIDGYNSSYELPSFFGSKLPKLPNELTLEQWNYTIVSYTQSSTETTIEFNLTKAVLDIFKNNTTFINNWGGLGSVDIEPYIKDTILTYYSLDKPSIRVYFYTKSLDSEIVHYTYDSTFILDNKQNFNGEPIERSGEIIYRIIIPKTGNYSYFIKFAIIEK